MSNRASSIARIARHLRQGSREAAGLLIPVVIAALLIDGRAFAHHSFAATYNEGQKITIEGTVLQFQFRNPHTFIHVQAPDEDGEMHRWAVEWSSPTRLTGQGVDRATLRPGDVVRITGSPGRDPSDHRMVMSYLIRPADGYVYGDDPGEIVD